MSYGYVPRLNSVLRAGEELKMRKKMSKGLHALMVCATLTGCSDGNAPPGPGGQDAALEVETPPPCTADTRTDPANCGSCGHVCDAEETCTGAECVPRDPLENYAGCREGGGRDPRCGISRRCVAVGSGGPRVCVPTCPLTESVCPPAPAGSDARVVCTREGFFCMLACTAATQCPAGLSCRLLPPGTAGYCAP